MKTMIDDEVEQLVGQRHMPIQADRPGYRWGKEEGHVVFGGKKVAIEKPRVRSRDGQEMSLSRLSGLFQSPPVRARRQ